MVWYHPLLPMMNNDDDESPAMSVMVSKISSHPR